MHFMRDAVLLPRQPCQWLLFVWQGATSERTRDLKARQMLKNALMRCVAPAPPPAVPLADR